MNFYLDKSTAVKYKNNSQKIRVMSENWVANNIFCPVCGNLYITKLKNNSPVSDFQCNLCGEIFELKSKNGKIGKKIVDGAYKTMIDRITSITNPNLFVMQYSDDFQVINLSLVPKFFLTPEIIEKRKPLSSSSKRAGWIGCNIIYEDIPLQGRIPIIEQQVVRDKNYVIDMYNKTKILRTNNIESRGWLMDVLNCINIIPTLDFSLYDVYRFADFLQDRHINNNNVKAKIRQQLQILRDKGFIEFVGKGHYHKIKNNKEEV